MKLADLTLTDLDILEKQLEHYHRHAHVETIRARANAQLKMIAPTEAEFRTQINSKLIKVEIAKTNLLQSITDL